MPAPFFVGTPTQAGVAAAATLTVNKPAGLQNGDLLVMFIRAQAVSSEMVKPAGWVRAGTITTALAAGRLHGTFYKVITDAAAETATSYAFSGWSSGRAVASMHILRGVDLTDPEGGGWAYTLTNPPAAYTVDAVPYLTIGMYSTERSAGGSMVPSTKPSDLTELVNIQNSLDTVTTTSRAVFWVGTRSVESGSLDVVPTAIAWASTSTTPRYSHVAFRGISDAIGKPIKMGDGSLARLSYIDTGDVRRTPASLRLTT